jgi:hypothetical protein
MISRYWSYFTVRSKSGLWLKSCYLTERDLKLIFHMYYRYLEFGMFIEYDIMDEYFLKCAMIWWYPAVVTTCMLRYIVFFNLVLLAGKCLSIRHPICVLKYNPLSTVLFQNYNSLLSESHWKYNFILLNLFLNWNSWHKIQFHAFMIVCALFRWEQPLQKNVQIN